MIELLRRNTPHGNFPISLISKLKDVVYSKDILPLFRVVIIAVVV